MTRIARIEAPSRARETGTLADADLDHVAGGLNPQPLPPRWSTVLGLIKVKTSIPVKQVLR